jgi:hypothetical protein
MDEERVVEVVGEEEPTIELVTLQGVRGDDPCDPDGGWCVPNCGADCSPDVS